MTTQTKHDGYAVFSHNDGLLWWTIRDDRMASVRAITHPDSWSSYEDLGYTVRPVTITEVKDDE